MTPTRITEDTIFASDISINTVLLPLDSNTYYKLLSTDTIGESPDGYPIEELVLQNIHTEETFTVTYPEINQSNEITLFEAHVIPPTVVENPTQLVKDYAEHHISTDLDTLGRDHPHSVADSIAIIEYAINTADL